MNLFYRALKQNKDLKEKMEQLEERFVTMVTTASVLLLGYYFTAKWSWILNYPS